MQTFTLVIALMYAAAILPICIYSIAQLQLLSFYRKKKDDRSDVVQFTGEETNLPIVTIQLPLYNELYVIERLIDSVCAFQYPKDKMQIQLLDDSTDETVKIVADKVNHYKSLGFDIEHVRRPIREGFKAGALNYGLEFAKGEFVTIFDADFVPASDFLLKTVPHFLKNDKVAVVQTKWEHLNKDYSLLTKLQAFQLDVHFTIEQEGRYRGDCFLQFNGTAGLWRISAIADAGGWEADTLTEDLDLSYRAQLKGWKIVYVENLGSPAELPAEINGFKSQQFRWTKGGAETARKMLPIIWNSNLPWRQKFHAMIHLLGSTFFVMAFIVALLSAPLSVLHENLKDMNMSFLLLFAPIFYFSMFALSIVYFYAHVDLPGRTKGNYLRRFFEFVTLYPAFMAMSVGFSLHNTVAVIQGWLGQKSAFIRTPKFNITEKGKEVKKTTNYKMGRISLVTIFEGVLSAYFIVMSILAYQEGGPVFMFYPLINALGFGVICFASIRNTLIRA